MKYSPEELRDMLEPLNLKTSSLSKKDLVLLCEAHVIIGKLRKGAMNCPLRLTNFAHIPQSRPA
jgi:hypothetical protein